MSFKVQITPRLSTPNTPQVGTEKVDLVSVVVNNRVLKTIQFCFFRTTGTKYSSPYKYMLQIVEPLHCSSFHSVHLLIEALTSSPTYTLHLCRPQPPLRSVFDVALPDNQCASIVFFSILVSASASVVFFSTTTVLCSIHVLFTTIYVIFLQNIIVWDSNDLCIALAFK